MTLQHLAKGQFLKCHYCVIPIHKSLHDSFSQVKRYSKLMQVLIAHARGYEGVGVDIRDTYNYERDMREQIDNMMQNSSLTIFIENRKWIHPFILLMK